MKTFQKLEPELKDSYSLDSDFVRFDLDLSHWVELTGKEIDLLTSLLSGRIAMEFYQTSGVYNKEIEFLENLQRRLGKFINVDY